MDDRVMGAFVMAGSLIVLLYYGFFVFFSDFSLLVVKLTAFLVVAVVLGVAAWMGYTLATTRARARRCLFIVLNGGL